MARILGIREPGGLSAGLDKPAMALRSDLPASGVESTGGMSGIQSRNRRFYERDWSPSDDDGGGSGGGDDTPF